MDSNILQKIKDLISNDKIYLALQLLKKYLVENNSDNEYQKLVTIQESNYNSLKKSQMIGSIDSNEYNIGSNKIKINILDLLESLDINDGDQVKKEMKIQIQPKSKKSKKPLIGFSIFLIILFSGYTEYSFFRLFNNEITTEETQSDLLGETVWFTRDSAWTFISKENFLEFELLNEKIERTNYEKTVRLKLEDVKTKKLYHMKLFLRYEFFFCFWQLEDKVVFEYNQTNQ